mgnify:CR=1 FL=1
MLKTLQFLTLSLLLALSACSSISTNGKAKSFKAKQIPSAFKNSYKNWQQLKDKHNANYSYERDSLSPEGFHSSTKITVIDDQVEFRDFFEWQQQPYLIFLVYYETNTIINVHFINVIAESCV